MVSIGLTGFTTLFSSIILLKYSKRFRFITRLLLLHFTILSSSMGVILSSIFVSKTDNYFLSKIFILIAKIVLPLRFEGKRIKEPLKPVVYVSNHQSTLDLYYIACAIPRDTVILAKESLKYVPLMGLCMYLTGTIFINRSDRAMAVDSMKRVAEIMKEKKKSVLIFVEGTRSHSNKMLPFKKGAFRLALENGFDIVPLVCAGQSPVYSEKKMVFEPGVIPFKVLEAIPTEGMQLDKLMEITQKRMQDALDEMESKLI